MVSSADIPVTTSSVRFRFVFFSDPFVSYEGVGIDDIHIFDKAPVYTGPENPKEIIKNVSGTNWIHFSDVTGKRIASINPNGQNLGSTSVKVFINDTSSVRNNNKHYYLDRNIVVKPTNTPVTSVKLRFYFTDQESEYLLGAGGCDTCSKPTSAYDLGVNKYSYGPEEDGTLDDNHTNNYVFIIPDSVDIIPYDNGYYAEYNVSSFSEFWLNEGGVFKDTGLITAIDDPENIAAGFAVYPSPAKGKLYVSFKNPLVKIAYLKVVDLLGKIIIVQQNPQLQNGVDISRLTPGIYYLQVADEKTRKTVTKKFMVK
ncbi:MAG: T9SS type A sorting domain-containing protein [Sphingobacteriales bacterium]|nr:T9SS type A sorting domain-containing protein [Sphingobacteriales bacterium]